MKKYTKPSYIGILIGLIINIINIIICLKTQKIILKHNSEINYTECPLSVFNVFIICNSDTTLTDIYYYCIPIISCLAFLDNFIAQKSNASLNICKIITNHFIKGFSISFVILILSLIVTMCLFPMISPEITTGYFPLGYRGNVLNQLYINNPLIYILWYILLISIYSGAYSIFSFSISYIFDNKISILIFVALSTFAYERLIYFLGIYEYDIRSIIIPTMSNAYNKFEISLLPFLFIILFSLVIIFIFGKSKSLIRGEK